MSAPTITSVTTTDGSTAATDPAVNVDPNLANGDLSILIFTANTTHSTPTVPTGYTFLVSAKPAGDSRSGDRDQIMYRWCDGSEASTVTVDTGTSSVKYRCLALRISGADSTVNPVISAGAVGTSNTPDPDSVTPGATRDTLFVAIGAIEGTASAPSTAPTNYSHPSTFTQNTTGGGGATNGRTCIAERSISNTGAAEDPGAWGAWGASEDWAAWTLAVSAPAAGGGPSFVAWISGD